MSIEKKRFDLRLSQDIGRDIEAEAEAAGMSVNAWVTMILAASLGRSDAVERILGLRVARRV